MNHIDHSTAETSPKIHTALVSNYQSNVLKRAHLSCPNKGSSTRERFRAELAEEEKAKYATAKFTSSFAIIVLSNSLIQKGESVQEKESGIVEWVKEIEERRRKLDMQMDELDRQTARIEWRITQVEEFKRKIEEGAIQVPQPEAIVEKTELEMKTLAQLKGERTEDKVEIAVERQFYSTLVSYLDSKLESARGEPPHS